MQKNDLKNKIWSIFEKEKVLTTKNLVIKTGFSKASILNNLQSLIEEGKIVPLGKSNQLKYIIAEKEYLESTKKEILLFQTTLLNKNLSEDDVLKKIQTETGIFLNLPKNINSILSYSFTEMLNNAIDHSQSEEIKIKLSRKNKKIIFEIVDWGIGIFENIIKNYKLKNELEAIQYLLKGKLTTNPEKHSGEGVFFTSKLADVFTIYSSNKKVIFHGKINDIFIQNISYNKGTKIVFFIDENSKKETIDVFNKFTNLENFSFDKTQIIVKLYQENDNFNNLYLSRSQAKKILFNLEKFNQIILDFKNVESIGQAFADEIFRVWKNQYPNISIIPINTNENIDFMIKHVKNNLL